MEPFFGGGFEVELGIEDLRADLLEEGVGGYGCESSVWCYNEYES